MGGANFIPRAHNKFYTWQDYFYNYIVEKQSDFNIDEADIEEISAAKSRYEEAFDRASSPDTANRADRAERNRCEAEFQRVIRRIVNENIRYNSDVSSYDRQYIGLGIADTTLTAAKVPTSYPVLNVDFSQPQRHKLRIQDAKLDSKRKPAGVMGCEVWYAISDDMPQHASELRFAGVATKATFTLDFDPAEEGKKVWYRARWINTRGKHGGWGLFTGARIA